MAYETGGAAGPHDQLSKLRLFAEANGWTTNRNATDGTGFQLCISKNSAFYNFRSFENEIVRVNGVLPPSGRYGIAVSGSDGYGAGLTWDRQPGYAVDVTNGTPSQNQAHANMLLPVSFGPFPAYHLFAPDDDSLYLEVEVASTTFQRLGVGRLELFNAGASGGGRFFFATGGSHLTSSVSASHWLGGTVDGANCMEMVPFRLADYSFSGSDRCGSFVRAAFDSFDGWLGSGRTPGASRTGQAAQGGGVHDKVVRDLSPSPRNGVGVLLPNIVAANRSDEFLSPIGVMPGIRYMDMFGYTPGEEFSLGPDTWKVFPWYQKGGLSNNRGIAYKKVA